MLVTYSPHEVGIEVAGYTVSGFNAITVSGQEDSVTLVKGIKGKHTRIRNKDTSCLITISVLQTSYANDVFSEIVRLDKIYGRCLVNVYLKDRSGSTIIKSSNAYITGYPTLELTENVGERDWVIQCMSTDTLIVGGNQQNMVSVFDTLTSLF